MQKIHDGDCRNHERGGSLTHKVINQGYYWPKMFDDAKNYMKKCLQYQRFTLTSNRPSIQCGRASIFQEAPRRVAIKVKTCIGCNLLERPSEYILL